MARRTKIIATIGPASDDPVVIRQMIDAGVDVFRIGLAHGSLSEAVELEDLIVSRLGEDLMIEGYVKRRESRDVYRTCRGIG